MSPTRKVEKQPARKSQQTSNPSAAESTSAPTLAASSGVVTQPSGMFAKEATFRQQVMTSVELGDELETPLEKGGWTPQQTASLKPKLSKYDAACIAWRKKRDTSKEATAEFQATVDESVLLRNQLFAGLRIATQGSANPFREPNLRLVTSPGQLSVWFREVEPQLEAHKEALSRRFPSDVLELTRAQAAKLNQAIGAQTARRKKLPELTKKKKAARLELAKALEEQRFAAAIVFQRDKATLSRFVPLWDAKKRKAATPADPQPPSGAPPAPAEAAVVSPAAEAAAKPA